MSYNLFDTAEDMPALKLVLTSNRNIKRACKVMTQAGHLTDAQVMYYAEIGEVLPADVTDGKKEYEFEVKYPTVAITYAGLAQAIFYDCPEIVAENEDGVYEVVDQKLFDRLIRSEVQRGWADFLESFGGKTFEEALSFGLLPNDLNTGNMIAEMVRAAANDSTIMQLKDGVTE